MSAEFKLANTFYLDIPKMDEILLILSNEHKAKI